MPGLVRAALASAWLAPCIATTLAAQAPAGSVRGDPEAIADALAMVETMGGRDLWSRLASVHFVHRWSIHTRRDTYLEHEILDLTGSRSWVEMKSEIYHRVRAFSPEHGLWAIENGTPSTGSPKELARAMERAPFHFVRIARGVARGDPYYEVRFGPNEWFEGRGRRLEFYGPDGERHGWIVLNARKEPIVWGTTQYTYVFGPMARYGNLSVPRWAVTGNGAVNYEMVSLDGSTEPPDPALFARPAATEE